MLGPNMGFFFSPLGGGQVEYYMSDENLKYDKFFHEKIAGEKDGWLDACLPNFCSHKVGGFQVCYYERFPNILGGLVCRWPFAKKGYSIELED